MTAFLYLPFAAGVLALAVSTHEPLHDSAPDDYVQLLPATAAPATAAPAPSDLAATSSESQSLGETRKLLRGGERPPLDGGGYETGDIVRVLGALGIVVALIVLTRTVLLRTAGGLGGAGRPSGVLEILARYPVGRGQQLMLLKLGRRILLVHGCGGAMRTLSEISANDEVAALLGRIEAASTGRESQRFRRLLERFEREHDQRPHADRGEIVDLTRRPSAGSRSFASWLGLGRSSP
jgi:flagellar biogenesis protein FliO